MVTIGIASMVLSLYTTDFSFNESKLVTLKDSLVSDTNINETVSAEVQQLEQQISEIQIEDSNSVNSLDSIVILNIPDSTNLVKNYIVVLGTFKIINNANNLISELNNKGWVDSYIYKKGEFNYVVLNSFYSRKEANQALSDSKLDGWVKKI